MTGSLFRSTCGRSPTRSRTPSFSRARSTSSTRPTSLAGGTDARHTLFARDDLGTGQVPATTYDPGEPNLYFLEDWNGNDGSVGSLQLFAVSGPVGAEEFRSISFPATEDVWDDAPPDGKDFAPQMGTAAKISVQTADFTHVIVRNGLITAAQTIFLPSGSPQRASIQWWQLTGDGFVVQRGRVDDPASQLFFAFPSVAANVNNDLLVGLLRVLGVLVPLGRRTRSAPPRIPRGRFGTTPL